jgi:hypothetical protein
MYEYILRLKTFTEVLNLKFDTEIIVAPFMKNLRRE